MPMRDSALFEEMVATCFRPLADKLHLPLNKIGDGAYEIPSDYFIARIRLDTGHARGLNVILRSASIHDDKQFGIRHFVDFHDGNSSGIMIDVFTDNDFRKQVQLLAHATERYLAPYLLGDCKDWDAVKAVVQQKVEKTAEEARKRRFASNKQKGWS